MTAIDLTVMEAIVADRQDFIQKANASFRSWVRAQGGCSGIALAAPTRGKAIMTRQQLVESNLHEFEQQFDCGCGYRTHKAGSFWDHVRECSTVLEGACL